MDPARKQTHARLAVKPVLRWLRSKVQAKVDLPDDLAILQSTAVPVWLLKLLLLTQTSADHLTTAYKLPLLGQAPSLESWDIHDLPTLPNSLSDNGQHHWDYKNVMYLHSSPRATICSDCQHSETMLTYSWLTKEWINWDIDQSSLSNLWVHIVDWLQLHLWPTH